jgi:E3 ubiquitin-protein ligase RBBP6
MANAVLASKCCFDSFCDWCIRDHIAAKSKCACGAQACVDNLIPNPTLRTTIANVLATTGGTASASSGTEKPRSSASSNAAEAAPQSLASLQASRSNVSSKKSATISSGVLGPRKAWETVAGDHSAKYGALAVDGDHHGSYGFPFGPVPGYVDPFFGVGVPFGADPYMYYGVPYGCCGAAYGYYGDEDRRDTKRTRLR